MADWNWITDRIAIGSEPSRADIPTMLRQGITDVLDLRGEPHQGETGPHPEMYDGTGIRYHYVGMLDRGGAQPAEKYVDGVQTIYDALAQPGAKVLVHCAAGVSRSPSMVYAYLRSAGMSDADAWDLIRTHRTVASRQYFDSANRALPLLPHGASSGSMSAFVLGGLVALGVYLFMRKR